MNIRSFKWIVLGAPSHWRCAKFNHTALSSDSCACGLNDRYWSLLCQIFEVDCRDSVQTVDELEDNLHEYLKHCVYGLFPQVGDDFKTELIQQTNIKIWMKAGQCEGSTKQSILAWIKIIAHNTGINMLRDGEKLDLFIDIERKNVISDAFSAENQPWDLGVNLWGDNPDSQYTMEDEIIFDDWIRALIKKLTTQERKVFLLRRYGYSKTEIAGMMKISKPRVSQYLGQIQKKNY